MIFRKTAEGVSSAGHPTFYSLTARGIPMIFRETAEGVSSAGNPTFSP